MAYDLKREISDNFIANAKIFGLTPEQIFDNAEQSTAINAASVLAQEFNRSLINLGHEDQKAILEAAKQQLDVMISAKAEEAAKLVDEAKPIEAAPAEEVKVIPDEKVEVLN